MTKSCQACLDVLNDNFTMDNHLPNYSQIGKYNRNLQINNIKLYQKCKLEECRHDRSENRY